VKVNDNKMLTGGMIFDNVRFSDLRSAYDSMTTVGVSNHDQICDISRPTCDMFVNSKMSEN